MRFHKGERARRLGSVAHQVDGQLILAAAGPQIREGDDASIPAHHTAGKSLQVILVEKAQAEASLLNPLLLEPCVGDRSQDGQVLKASDIRPLP